MEAVKHILIVEDDACIRGVMTALLEAKGYRVVSAGNGREALDLLIQTEPPCVILLDLTMPIMDGWTFRQAQTQAPALASIPVLVISGESDLPTHAASLNAAV